MTDSPDVPPSVVFYDHSVDEALQRWASDSEAIGGELVELKTKACKVFDCLRNFLINAAGQQEPTEQAMQSMMTEMVTLVGEFESFKDKHRRSIYFNNISAVAEGIIVVGWVQVKKTPAPYVKSIADAAMFYINRVLTQYKDTDEKQVRWAKSWREVLEKMHTYVKQQHTTGLVWNSRPKTGNPIKSSVSSSVIRESNNIEELSSLVRIYDEEVGTAIAKWSELSAKLGGEFVELNSKSFAAFDKLRSILIESSGKVEPDDNTKLALMQPLNELVGKLIEYKDSSRRSAIFNHICAVADGLPVVGWVMVAKTPAPYIKDVIDSSMFYLNRVLKDSKDTNAQQYEWAQGWRDILNRMHSYVKQHHTTGLVWNTKPKTSVSKPTSVPPPPPPPDIAELAAKLAALNGTAIDSEKTSRDALFAEINKGQSVTAGLRKVTSDMQTHKNPALRSTSVVSVSSTKSDDSRVKPKEVKAARVYLDDGKQWNVEYYNGTNLEVDVADKRQTVYIYKCEKAVITIRGKVNSITLDACKKTSVVFDSLVAQCETINCQSVQIQALGEMPTLSIQKTDGCQVYLTEKAQKAEIISSKSSEMNVLLQMDKDSDYVEHPVPEQFKSTFVNGKLVTTLCDIV